jgi:SsrA-binding protein
MMKKQEGPRIFSANRRASFDYFLSDFLEVGIVLTGTEIKSLRQGGGSLNDSYVLIRGGELILLNMHIAPYERGNIFNHDPLRTRKLLAHRHQIDKLDKIVKEKGLTLVPIKLYVSHGRAKLEIAVGKGKKHYDKRETIKDRDNARKLNKALKGDLRD